MNRRSHNTELLGLRRRRHRRRPQLLLLNCSFQFISLPFSSELTFYNKHFNTAERFQKDITKTKLVNVVEKWLLILPFYFSSSNLLLLRLCVLFCRLLKAMVVSIEIVSMEWKLLITIPVFFSRCKYIFFVPKTLA